MTCTLQLRVIYLLSPSPRRAGAVVQCVDVENVCNMVQVFTLQRGTGARWLLPVL